MIIYSSNALQFRESVDRNHITVEIEQAFIKKMGMKPSPGGKRAWNNSMQFMERVIRNANIADDWGGLIGSEARLQTWNSILIRTNTKTPWANEARKTPPSSSPC
ncbi:hypothetical protein ABDI30_22090 [Paenibacillus cisolokensis]|uniref:hypothetical protein n=1 Tax=Paenibacillus cisolokensis TaxID=1658519 RepID=UPI003D267F44